MDFPKLSSPSLKDLFIREIESMILSGRLPIGRRLPPERELAKEMHVSRAVVNAGLVEMAKKGFIEIRPRVGAFITDYRRYGTTETLLSIMHYNGGTLRKTELKSLLEIRLVLETLALESAVPRLTKEDLAVLKELAEEFGGSEDPSESAQLIFRFHHELCVLSGNTLLPLIFHSFREPAINLWERYFTLHGVEVLHNSTMELYGCLERRDAERAVAVFRGTLQSAIDGGVSIYYE